MFVFQLSKHDLLVIDVFVFVVPEVARSGQGPKQIKMFLRTSSTGTNVFGIRSCHLQRTGGKLITVGFHIKVDDSILSPSIVMFPLAMLNV